MRIDQNEEVQGFAIATVTLALALGVIMCYFLN